MPKKRLTAIVNKYVWEKVTKGRAGIRWDNVAQEEWKDIGGQQEEAMPADKFGRYKTEIEENDKKKGKAGAKKTT